MGKTKSTHTSFKSKDPKHPKHKSTIHEKPTISSQAMFMQELAQSPALSALAGLGASFPTAKIFVSNAVPLLQMISNKRKLARGEEALSGLYDSTDKKSGRESLEKKKSSKKYSQKSSKNSKYSKNQKEKHTKEARHSEDPQATEMFNDTMAYLTQYIHPESAKKTVNRRSKSKKVAKKQIPANFEDATDKKRFLKEGKNERLAKYFLSYKILKRLLETTDLEKEFENVSKGSGSTVSSNINSSSDEEQDVRNQLKFSRNSKKVDIITSETESSSEDSSELESLSESESNSDTDSLYSSASSSDSNYSLKSGQDSNLGSMTESGSESDFELVAETGSESESENSSESEPESDSESESDLEEEDYELLGLSENHPLVIVASRIGELGKLKEIARKRGVERRK